MTELTPSQFKTLDSIADLEPLTKVVAWSDAHRSPVLEDWEGRRWVVSRRGTRKQVTL